MNGYAPVKALRLAPLRWLSSLAQALLSRFGKLAPSAHSDGIACRDSVPGLAVRNRQAAAIVDDARRRGASRLELTRAAVAAARAVLPLVRESNCEAIATLEAADAWTLNPTERNADIVWQAQKALDASCARTAANHNIASGGGYALTAVNAAAMACCAPFGTIMLALLAVECAGHAAGEEIELASLMTAVLL